MRFSVVLLAAVVMTAQEHQVGQGVNFYSRQKEAVLGAQLARELRQETTPLDSPTVRDFVEQIGRKLAAQLPVAGMSYTFAVVTDDLGGPTHEPLSVPGGYVFVPTSLILTAQNEAECAGMVGHAMAHVAERHGTRLASRGQLMGGTSTPFIFIGGWPNMGIGPSGQTIPLGFLTSLRAFESQSDWLAIQMTSAAGYDPEAIALYIGRVQTEDNTTQKVFSTLPSRASRIADMKKAIQKLPSNTYSSSDEFPRIQSEVRQLTSH